MTKEEISKAIEECEERLKDLREELNKPEYGGKRWKPKDGEAYFYITSYGELAWTTWHSDNLACNCHWNIGNVFPTREAANFEIEHLKVIAELSAFAEGDEAVWDGEQYHFQLYYNHFTKSIECDRNQVLKFKGLYFPSKEAVRAAVEAVGEERVKKYYLGVKE